MAQIALFMEEWASSENLEPDRALVYLTDELVRRGHELFVSADSRISAARGPVSDSILSDDGKLDLGGRDNHGRRTGVRQTC